MLRQLLSKQISCFSKIKNNSFIKLELQQNPEFDKAFPHLKPYKPITYIAPKSEEYDYMESLSYHKKYPEPKTAEDLFIEKDRRFVEGYREPGGPLKWMEDEEKIKIHELIDIKLGEIEQTNLSREEILYDDGRKGIPLPIDPFFQLLKKNRLAREILLKPGEAFTVARVVDLALKQDIGIDPDMGTITNEYYKDDMLEKLKKTMSLRSQGRMEDKDAERSKEYFAADSYPNPNKLKEILNKNIDYHYKPLSKAQMRRRNKKAIDWLDIHWRNTELLTKYLNPSGKIKSRFQTRLPSCQQRKIAKTIRHSRHLMLLPYASFVKPSDKRSLKTLQEDIEDYCRKAINIETGHIYLKGSEQEPKMKQNVDEFMDSVPRDFDEKRYDNIKDLEFAYLPFMPTKKEFTLLEATVFANKLKEDELIRSGVDVAKVKDLNQQKSISSNPLLSKLNEDRENEQKMDMSEKKKLLKKLKKKSKD